MNTVLKITLLTVAKDLALVLITVVICIAITNKKDQPPPVAQSPSSLVNTQFNQLTFERVESPGVPVPSYLVTDHYTHKQSFLTMGVLIPVQEGYIDLVLTNGDWIGGVELTNSIWREIDGPRWTPPKPEATKP